MVFLNKVLEAGRYAISLVASLLFKNLRFSTLGSTSLLSFTGKQEFSRPLSSSIPTTIILKTPRTETWCF